MDCREKANINSPCFYKRFYFEYLSTIQTINEMNDQKRSQYYCQIAILMNQLPKPKSSKSVQEEHPSGSVKLQIDSKQDVSKKTVNDPPHNSPQISKPYKRGSSPRYVLQQERQREGTNRLQDSGSSGSNRTEHQYNSLSYKVLQGDKDKHEEERNLCQVSSLIGLEQAKQAFRNVVALQLPPETSAYLKGSFKELDKLLLEESKLIKSLLNVKNQRNIIKRAIISKQSLTSKKFNTLNIAYLALQECFYRENQFNYQFEKQSLLQKREKRILEYKRQIAALTGQNQQLNRELLRNTRSRHGQEAESEEDHILAKLEEDNRNLREIQKLMQDKIDKLQRSEARNIEKIQELEQEKQHLCSEITRFVQGFQKQQP